MDPQRGSIELMCVEGSGTVTRNDTTQNYNKLYRLLAPNIAEFSNKYFFIMLLSYFVSIST